MALQVSGTGLFCRLCLDELNMVYMFSSDALTRMIICSNFPKMNLDVTDLIRLCKDCYTNLNFTMMVKSGFPLKRKDFLQQKFSIVSNIKFCVFCLLFEINTAEESIFLNDRYGPTQVKKIVEYAIPEFKFIEPHNNICTFCWSWIWKICSFKQQCNQVENVLLQTCHDNHLNSLTDADIYTLMLLNSHIKYLRQQIQKEKHETVDLSQQEFQSYISRAKQNYSKLVLTLESNAEYVRMNLDIIRHMEYYFATGEIYPNPGDSNPDRSVNQNNFLQTDDNEGLYAYNINPTALQAPNNDNKNFVPTIELLDESNEECVVNQHSGDDDTLSSDEIKTVKLDIDETDLKLQLCEAENATPFESTKSDFDLEAGLQVENAGLPIEASGSVPAARDDSAANHDIEEDISAFHIHSELLTELIDGNAQQDSGALEMPDFQSPTLDNYCTFEETSRQLDVAGNLRESIEDDCYEVEADLNQPINLTRRSWKEARTAELTCWGCYVCAAKFRLKNSIIKHTLTHERPWNKFGKFCCRFCPYRSNWRSSVTRHASVHQFPNLHVYSTINYFCIFCDLVFTSKGVIQTHMMKHIITWNHFQCLLCMFAGKSSESLRLHYRQFHPFIESVQRNVL